MRWVLIALLACSGCGGYWSRPINTVGAIAATAVAGAALVAGAAGTAASWKERAQEEGRRRQHEVFVADLVPYEAVLTDCPGCRNYSRVCDHASGCRYETSDHRVFRCGDRDCTQGAPTEVLSWCAALR